MDQIHRLNEDEIAGALSGKPADERIAECPSCAAEFAEWTDLGGRLRQDMAARAERPAFFWTRQGARIRERLTPHGAGLRWVAGAICALVLLATGLIHQSAAPRRELAQTTTPTNAMRATDPDDALLQDVQTSLDRDVPAPLEPAAMLVDEMASAPQHTPQVKEN
jgi:hypothetical protein